MLCGAEMAASRLLAFFFFLNIEKNTVRKGDRRAPIPLSIPPRFQGAETSTTSEAAEAEVDGLALRPNDYPARGGQTRRPWGRKEINVVTSARPASL